MKKIPTILISLAVILIASFLALKSHFKPHYDGMISSHQIKDKVSVRRDTYGVPKIHAKNFNDAYFALG
ncbi:penicillin acylase family protein, partial [bacterium]|nr:penicillin acylase family protein [bacterium]